MSLSLSLSRDVCICCVLLHYHCCKYVVHHWRGNKWKERRKCSSESSLRLFHACHVICRSFVLAPQTAIWKSNWLQSVNYIYLRYVATLGGTFIGEKSFFDSVCAPRRHCRRVKHHRLGGRIDDIWKPLANWIPRHVNVYAQRTFDGCCRWIDIFHTKTLNGHMQAIMSVTSMEWLLLLTKCGARSRFVSIGALMCRILAILWITNVNATITTNVCCARTEKFIKLKTAARSSSLLYRLTDCYTTQSTHTHACRVAAMQLFSLILFSFY